MRRFTAFLQILVCPASTTAARVRTSLRRSLLALGNCFRSTGFRPPSLAFMTGPNPPKSVLTFFYPLVYFTL